MSIQYNSYTPGFLPNRKIRKVLEKFHNSIERPPQFHFNYSSESINIAKIPWDELKGFDFTQGGSSPIFLCGFESNRACTIKGVSNSAEEIFTILIYSLLSVHVPTTKLIQFKSREFKQAIDALQRVSLFDLYLENCINKELDRPFLIVQDYVPGTYFLQMGRSKVELCFSQDPELGYRRLREIGEILAVDILLNNSNRIPLIWNTEGNPNSFLISAQSLGLTSEGLLSPDTAIVMKNIYAIDSNCSTLLKSDESTARIYNQYLERVERFVRGTVRDLEDALQGKSFGLMALSTMESVKDFFYRHARIELNNQQLFQVLKGVMGTFKEIAEMELQELVDVYDEVKNKVDEDWMGVWNNGFEKINLEFILDVKNVINKIVTEFPQSFEWIYQMYKINDSPLYF